MYVNVYSDAFELISTEYLESLNQADFLAYSSNFAEYGMYVCMYVRTYMYVCMYVCMCTYVCVCMYIYMYVCIYVCMYYP